MGNNKRSVGTQYEEQAVIYLRSLGYQILEQNYRCRMGEIDIIGRQEGYLCFIEVKYRQQSDKGGPLAAVGWKKQKRISGVASYYLTKKNIFDSVPCRFDVIGITPLQIQLVKNAFDYID